LTFTIFQVAATTASPDECGAFDPIHALVHLEDYVPFILLLFIPLIVYYVSINTAQLKMQEVSLFYLGTHSHSILPDLPSLRLVGGVKARNFLRS